MSIKYNGKTIAGGYVPKVSSELEHGIIRIATNEEVRQGRSNDVAITPKQLNDFGGRANLFDTKVLDYVLPYEKSEGWALQGTYVYKTAILNERYGYPTFIEECINQKNQSIPTEVTLGNSIITMYIHSNGHKFYDISDKDIVDAWFETYGIADFYGIDVENECVFLPRNNYFMQLTTDTSKVNNFNEAGLPNVSHTHSFSATTGSAGAHTHGIYSGTSESGSTFGFGSTRCSGAGGGDNAGTMAYRTKLEKNSTQIIQNAGAHTHSVSGTTGSNGSVNSIYGKSNTVQPPSSNKLLYYCVGNTISDTSWIDTVTQTANGVQEIEDKRASSLEDIETARVNAVTNIEVDRANAITNIETDRLNAVNEIEADRSSAVLEINTDRVNAVDEIEQHRKQALTDLINTENAGISALSNASNALRQTQITNCITEIPQRIKLELVDGVAILKAGSEVIVPNGANVFDYIKIESDLSFNYSGTGTTDIFLLYNFTSNVLGYALVSTAVSGTTAPTDSRLYYDTANNIIDYYNNGVPNNIKYALPIAILSRSGGTITGIKQVLNGIGYIGSTVWVDKGVKVLSVNGRNGDLTLNNIETKTSELSLVTITNDFGDTELWLSLNNSKVSYMTTKSWQYDSSQNSFILNDNFNDPRYGLAVIGSFKASGTISNFNTKQPFRAVDQNSIWYDSSTSTLYIGV